jgi:dihydrofolate reductase
VGTVSANRVVLTMSVSVDGYFEGPNREIDWHLVDEELHRHMNQWLATAGAFLEGRVSYELMTSVWPAADRDPGSPPTIAEFARIWVEMPKVLYSRTREHADWNTTVAREVVPDEVRALAERADGDLVVGGADLAATFFEHDLIDEIRLYVHPVVLGEGRPLFPRGMGTRALRLAETRTFGNGVVLLRYRLAR